MQLGTPNLQALFAHRLLGGAAVVPYRLRDMAKDAVGSPGPSATAFTGQALQGRPCEPPGLPQPAPERPVPDRRRERSQHGRLLIAGQRVRAMADYWHTHAVLKELTKPVVSLELRARMIIEHPPHGPI